MVCRKFALCLCVRFMLLPHALADTQKPAFPGAEWDAIAKPESAGYSSARLEVLRLWLKTHRTTAMMVAVGGRVLFQYGDVTQVSVLASARKSVLGILYGKYVVDGTIDLSKTLKEAGLEDVQKFLPVEQVARVGMLLEARSGVFHPDGDTDPLELCPVRGSQYPGTFFCYNNWDFNAAGTAFEKMTGKNIYDALESDLARPIGMQDFDRERQKKVQVLPASVHPEYHMYLSTRDMARIGLLMLNRGKWGDKELVNPNWVAYQTTLMTRAADLYPRGFAMQNQIGPARWGFGAMWWVWDTPKLSQGVSAGDFYGAYTAMGMGGQYITVLPARDMVVVHKVDLDEVRSEDYVDAEDFQTILQMVVQSACKSNCR